MRPWRHRLLVLALCLPFVQCLWRRTVTTRPAATVTVVDADGRPVGGAEVVVYWWSYPHRRLHERFVERTGADGRAAFAGARRRETIAPLCMHGVPQHQHTVCVDVPGRGVGTAALERDGDEVVVTLAPDERGKLVECKDLARQAQPAPGGAPP
ncbi:MAG: hypothetical protein HS111_22270 [Kofleriaceae bacterium]|nr:hypothetical protein [Kofleriaceae bacterium]MCL4224416.1 hypothetical protein [Myxococcales bacterium]